MTWIVPGKGMRNLSLIKMLMIMKLIMILMLVATLHVSADSFGQRVTMNVKDAPLTQVFKMLSAQTGQEFLLNPVTTDHVQPVTINVKDFPVEAFLERLTKERGLHYTIVNNIIIVTREVAKQPADTVPIAALRPNVVISGTVMDINGEPLPGATLMIQGTRRGTQTAANGHFEIHSDQVDNTLVITYTGYGVLSTKAILGRPMTIMMRPAKNDLDLVQVIGYGRTSKRFNTGNVVTVRGEDIQKNPVTNVLAALQGRVPGMIITQATGIPGGAVNVNIRGTNSLAAGTEPLYIIDGVPYPPGTINNGGITLLNQTLKGGNYLNYFNPADIESVDVLKDADATSIYGSRGANGVILITTKKGKPGRARIDLNAYTGISTTATAPKLLNLQQYLTMRHEAKRNDNAANTPFDYDINGTWDTTRYTDWQKLLLKKKAYLSNGQISMSGGGNNSSYLVGAGYTRQTSVMPGDGANQQANVHFSTTAETNNKKVAVMLSGSYNYTYDNIQAYDFSRSVLQLAPDAPKIYNDDGSLNYENNTFDNPFRELNKIYKNRVNNLVGNASISYRPVKGLEIKTVLGYNNGQISEFLGTPMSYYSPASLQLSGAVNQSLFRTFNNSTWSVEPQANYSIALGKGVLNALAGATFQSSKDTRLSQKAIGFSNDALLENPGAADSTLIDDYSYSLYNYNAAFGRLNYSWNNKYILNLTGRYDGSSRFGPGRQFHFFGAVGAAWIFTEEAWVKNNVRFLSFGKLRGSYGTTGNDRIGDYKFYDLYNPGSQYQGQQGLLPASLFNPELQWETNKKAELGLELGFLKDRIAIEGSYYRNRSSNQLFPYNLARTTGFNSILLNLPAVIQNSGIEITLRTTNIRTKTFTWTTSFNISANHNKLVDYPGLASSTYTNIFVIGQPIYLVKVFKYAGVDPAKGVYTFYDSKGSITTTPSETTDRTEYIDTSPKYFGGLLNSFQYKGFSLDFNFSFISRMAKNAFGQQQGIPPGFFYNMTTDVQERWQKPGDVTDTRSYTSSILGLFAQGNAINSTRAYSMARYARLQNLAFSYQLPQSLLVKWRITNIRLYLQGQNLFTISNFKNVDPENLDATSLPPLRQYTAGFQVTL